MCLLFKKKKKSIFKCIIGRRFRIRTFCINEQFIPITEISECENEYVLKIGNENVVI